MVFYKEIVFLCEVVDFKGDTALKIRVTFILFISNNIKNERYVTKLFFSISTFSLLLFMTDFFTLGYGRSCNTGTIVRTTAFPQACGAAVS